MKKLRYLLNKFIFIFINQANLITINQEEIELQKELEILSSKQKNIICAKKQKNNQYYLQYDLQFQSNLKENGKIFYYY